jgi:hypothetical protein
MEREERKERVGSEWRNEERKEGRKVRVRIPICAILNTARERLCVSKSPHADFSSRSSNNILFRLSDSLASVAPKVRNAPEKMRKMRKMKKNEKVKKRTRKKIEKEIEK